MIFTSTLKDRLEKEYLVRRYFLLISAPLKTLGSLAQKELTKYLSSSASACLRLDLNYFLHVHDASNLERAEDLF